MTAEQFAYWLKGIAETSEGAPTDKQWLVIKDHLDTVFTKVTPDREAPLRMKPLSPREFDILRDGLRTRQPAPHRYDDILIC